MQPVSEQLCSEVWQLAGGQGEEPSTAHVLGWAPGEKARSSPSVGTEPNYSPVCKNEMGNEKRSQGQGTREIISCYGILVRCLSSFPRGSAVAWQRAFLACWSAGKREGA